MNKIFIMVCFIFLSLTNLNAEIEVTVSEKVDFDSKKFKNLFLNANKFIIFYESDKYERSEEVTLSDKKTTKLVKRKMVDTKSIPFIFKTDDKYEEFTELLFSNSIIPISNELYKVKLSVIDKKNKIIIFNEKNNLKLTKNSTYPIFTVDFYYNTDYDKDSKVVK